MGKELQQIDWSAADEAFAKMSDGFVDWCREIWRINEDGDRQQAIAKRYGKSRPAIAQACQIGSSKIVSIANNLPSDQTALYELVVAHNEHGEKVTAWLEKHPEPKRAEVKKMRAELSPEEKPAPKTETCWVGLVERITKPTQCKGDFTHLLRDNKEKIEAFTGATIAARMTAKELDALVPSVELFLIDKYSDYKSELESDANESSEELSEKEKFERATKKRERLIDIQIEEKVRERIQAWLDYINGELDELSEFRARHKAPFSVEQYKGFRAFCHPDRHPGNEEKAGEYFRLLDEKEDVLCDGIRRNKKVVEFPRTVAEMMARRAAK
jgi:hypothetical protein